MIMRAFIVACAFLALSLVNASENHLPENWRDTFCGTGVNCYKALNLTETCTTEDIAAAFKKLARKYHPDRNLKDKEFAKERFQEIQLAREILSNPEKRKIYDDVTRLRARLYVPRESPILVILFVISGCFGAAYFFQLSEYNYKRKGLLANNAIKNRLRVVLQNEGKAVRIKNNKLEVDVTDKQLTDAVVALGIRVKGGWTGEKPKMSSIIMATPLLPFKFIGWTIWCIKWIIMYTILNCEYQHSDKEYLCWKNLDLTQYDWQQMTEDERQEHLRSEPWKRSKSRKTKKQLKKEKREKEA